MKLLAFLGALSLTFLTQAQDTIPNTVLNSLKFEILALHLPVAE